MRLPRVSWIVRLGVSVLILAALLAIIPVGDLAGALARVPPSLWLGTLAAFLVAHAAGALKWRLLMPDREALAPRYWLTAHFAGLTANLFLPGVAGGDVVRAGWLIKHAGRAESIAVAGVVDRAIDTGALLALGTSGLLLTQASGGPAYQVAVATAVVLAGGAVGGGVLIWVLRRREQSGLAGRLIAALKIIAGRPDRLATAVLMSVCIQASFIWLNARLGVAAGVSVSFAAWLTAWPLAKLAALVPISLAGLGVREAALAAFMQPFGVRPGAVIAAGLLWQSVLFAGGLAGWLATVAWPPPPLPTAHRNAVAQ